MQAEGNIFTALTPTCTKSWVNDPVKCCAQQKAKEDDDANNDNDDNGDDDDSK